MRGTGDWATDERPLSWREAILLLYPNGMTPLTAILSMLDSQQVDDPQFHWWTKVLPSQAGSPTNDAVYTDALLTTAYVSGGVAGNTVYVKMSEDDASEFRIGHVAMLRKTDDYRYDTRGKVVAVNKAGANSYVAIKLLEDADATYDIDEADYIKVIGNMNAEGAEMPQSIQYDPTKNFNYTQIFRTPLRITRTARRTKLRTADAYDEALRECLELHAIEMEKAFIWGERYEGVNSVNNEFERTTRGLIPAILNDADATADQYHLNTSYSGQTWLQGGEKWLNEQLEVIFRYGSNEKMALVGSLALQAINDLAKISGQINLEVGTTSYGIRVMEWITPFGTIFLKTAPLFSYDPTNRRDMVIFEPRTLGTRYIDDTFFVSDPEDQRNRNNSRDSTEEEFITEIGLEYEHARKGGFLSGLGLTNTV